MKNDEDVHNSYVNIFKETKNLGCENISKSCVSCNQAKAYLINEIPEYGKGQCV